MESISPDANRKAIIAYLLRTFAFIFLIESLLNIIEFNLAASYHINIDKKYLIMTLLTTAILFFSSKIYESSCTKSQIVKINLNMVVYSFLSALIIRIMLVGGLNGIIIKLIDFYIKKRISSTPREILISLMFLIISLIMLRIKYNIINKDDSIAYYDLKKEKFIQSVIFIYGISSLIWNSNAILNRVAHFGIMAISVETVLMHAVLMIIFVMCSSFLGKFLSKL